MKIAIIGKMGSGKSTLADKIINYYKSKNIEFKKIAFADNVYKIAHIPTNIVQGRYDVVCPMTSAWELHKKLPKAQFDIIQDAGHSMLEIGIQKKLIEITDSI